MGKALPLRFDTLNYKQALQDAGVPEPQAQAHATLLAGILDQSVISEDLATLEQSLITSIDTIEYTLTQRLKKVENSLQAESQNLGNNLEAKLEGVAARLESKIVTSIHTVQLDLAKMAGEQTLLKWMSGTSIALSIAILIKLFIH